MRGSYLVRVVHEPYEVSFQVYFIDGHTATGRRVLGQFVARRETCPALTFPFLSPGLACGVDVCAGDGSVLRGARGKIEPGKKNYMMHFKIDNEAD